VCGDSPQGGGAILYIRIQRYYSSKAKARYCVVIPKKYKLKEELVASIRKTVFGIYEKHYYTLLFKNI
jgi:hypothetical protein